MLAPGTLLHQRYEIVGHIGQGSHGAVYEARDGRLGGKPVALKQLIVTDPLLVENFEREVRMLALLSHPTLPQVSDYFAEHGTSFMVMEFVPGPNLAELLSKHGPFSLEWAQRYAEQLLAAVRYLHSQQPPVIHRDIKPANLKLRTEGRLVLLDFGLAKGLKSQHSRSKSWGGGTEAYAPIEQYRGQHVDERSDLYAIGATLYELLTGQPPATAIERMVLPGSSDPDPLAPPQQLNPAIPAAVGAVLMQALALDSAARPASATALRDQLRAAWHGTPAPQPQQPAVRSSAGQPTVAFPASAAPPVAAATPVQRSSSVPVLVPVPAGRFLMGSSDDDLLSDGDEKPQHELVLPAYWIGRTPVTNAQFRAFVEGDGYTNRAYWTGMGWVVCDYSGWQEPESWRNQNHTRDDQPVVGVSWFEAVAFCRWLSAQTGRPFRLATEAEWEKAARGPQGLIWPWGNRWDASRCTSEEAGVQRATPVDQHPAGASPYGALDMVGNLWEWTSTAWIKRYPYHLEDEWLSAYLEGDSTRVLRGGSWATSLKRTRTAFRSGDVPRKRADRSGFGLRLASSVP